MINFSWRKFLARAFSGFSASPISRRPRTRIGTLPPSIEALETRVLLSVSAALQPDGSLDVDLTEANDSASILTDAGQIQVKDLHTNQIVSAFDANLVHAIHVEGRHLDAQSITFSGTVNLTGALKADELERIELLGSYSAKSVELHGKKSVAMGPDSLLSTRAIASGADPLSADSTGNSGKIKIESKSISVAAGGKLLAHVEDESPFKAGDVSLAAEDTSVRELDLIPGLGTGSDTLPLGAMSNASPVGIQRKEASISINSATIRGGEIHIEAAAADRSLTEDLPPYVDNIVGGFFDQLSQLPGIGQSTLSGITAQVNLRASTSTINLVGSTISGGKVEIVNESVSNASMHIVAMNAKGSPVAIAVGYGQAEPHSITTIKGTSISGEDGVVIETKAVGEAEVKARVSANLNAKGAEINRDQTAIAAAIAVQNLVSKTTVDQFSTIQSEKGNVDIKSEGEGENLTLAQPMIFEDGVAGIGVGLSIDHATVLTTVDGTIKANGAPKAEFDPAKAVDLVTDIVTVPGHGFTDGQEIVYHAGEGKSIQGLKDGDIYFVKVIDTDHIQLKLTNGIDLKNADVEATATHTLSRRAVLSFNADAISGDSIYLPGHPLADGQKIAYFSNVKDDLASGTEYLVQRVDADHVRLFDTRTDQFVSAKGKDDKDNAWHALRYEEAAVGFNPATAVDSDSDLISLPGNSLKTGEAVVYRVDPNHKNSEPLYRITESATTPGLLERNKVGQLNVPDSPIEGLTDGVAFFVVRVDDDHIRLETTRAAALAAGGHVDLTGKGKGTEHRFGDSGITISSKLEASNTSQSAAVLTGEEIGWQEVIAEGLVNTDFLIAGISKIPTFQQGATDGAKGGAEAPLSNLGKGSQFAVAGSISVNFFDHDVKAEVGKTAVLESLGDIEVAAEITNSVQVAVAAGASKPEGSDAAASIALGVGIGLYENSAEALIHGGAQVDTSGALSVESKVEYPFLSTDPLGSINPGDYLKESGVEGWAFFLDGTFSFASNFFNTWVLSEADGGQVGIGGSIAVMLYDNTSKAMIESGAKINQKTDEKYRKGPQTVEVLADNTLSLIEAAGVASLNLTPAGGLDALKATEISQGLSRLVNPLGSKGEKGGIGASVLFDKIDNTTIAEVQDGVSIHTGVPGDGEEGGLKISATQSTFSFGIAQSGANASEFAISGSLNGAIINDTTHARLGGEDTKVTGGPIAVTANDNMIRTSVAGGVVIGESVGVGISAAFNIVQRDTAASIGLPRDKTSVPATNKPISIDVEGPVEVEAHNEGMIWGFTLAAAVVQDAPPAPAPPDATPAQPADPMEGVPQDAGPTPELGMTGIAIAGDASLNIVTDDTFAFINTDGEVKAESIGVSSKSDSEIWTFAGAAAVTTNSEQSAGIAGSFSSNVVDATTHAFIRGGKSLDITADSLDVEADFSGSIHSFTAGGAAATSQTSFAVAGSVSVNIILIDTQSYVQAVDAKLTDDSEVTAVNKSEIWALAGGVAFGGKAGIGAAVAVNMIGFSNDLGLLSNRPASTQAYIKDSRITLTPNTEEDPLASAKLTVSANSDSPHSAPRIIALTGALAASKDSQGVSAAGMVSVNIIHDTTTAFIENSTIDDDATTPGHGDVDLDVSALDNSWIISIGGAVAVAMGAGVGVAIGYNQIGTDGKDEGVRAYLKKTNVRIGGDVSVSAESHAEIEGATVGVAAGAGSSGIAGAGSAGVNIINQTIDARIIEGSSVHVGKSVDVEAADRSMIVSITGGGAFGTRASVGVAASYNLISNTVSAAVEGSTVKTDLGSVKVDATDSALLVAAAVGVAGSTGSLAIGGSVTVNSVSNTVDAHISKGSTISTAGNLDVAAGEQTSMVVVAGAVGVSGTGAAIGAAVAYNYMGGSFDPMNPEQKHRDSTAVNAVSANIDASQVEVAGNLTVAAGFKPSKDAKTRINARKSTFGSSNVDTAADTIGLGTQPAPETGTAVIYHAEEGSPIDLETDDDQKETKLNDGQIYYVIRKGDHSVQLAATYEDAKAGKALRFSSGGTAKSQSIEVGIAPVEVSVPLDDQIVNVVVSGGAGTSAAVVGAVGLNFIHNSVEARIANTSESQRVSATGSVKVLANENSAIYGGSGSVAGSASAAVGASATINDISNKVHANISQATVRSANDDVDVVATSTSTIYSAAVGASAGGEAAVAAAVVVSFLRNDTQAFITSSSNVSAKGDIDVKATDLHAKPDDALNDDIITFGGQIAASGTVAGGAANSTNDIQNKTHAYIRKSVVTAGQSLKVSAETEKSILSGAIMGAFSGSGVSIAGAVTVNMIKNDTQAFIAGAADVRTNAGDIVLFAEDKSRIRSLAGQGAASAGAGIGAALSYNKIANKVHAYIDGQTETAKVTTDNGSVLITARSEPTIGTVAAGLSASLASVAGSAAVNMMDNDTAAFINKANVASKNNVVVLAESHGDTTGTGGTVAAGGFGFGGTAVVNIINNKTQAYVSQSTVQADGDGAAASVPLWSAADGKKSTENVNGLAVIADSTEKLLAVNVTAAIGGTAGIAANVAVNRLSDTTKAYIDSSKINDDDNKGAAVVVRAHQDTDLTSGGGVLSGGAAGVGAVIDINIVNNETFAGITSSDKDHRSEVFAEGDVEVNALSRESAKSTTVGAVLGGLALAGAASVVKMGSSTVALVSESDVNTDGNLSVLANNSTNSSIGAGALSAGALGAGGSIAVSLISNSTAAKIVGGSTNSSKETRVKATSTNTVLAAGASAAAAAAGGLSFVIAVDLFQTSTTAAIESGDRNSSVNQNADYTKPGQKVSVDASNVTKATDGIGTAAVGAGAGFGAAVDVIILKNTVDAHIGANSIVSAVGDVTVDATATKNIESTVVAFAGSGIAALAGAVSFVSIAADVDSENSSGVRNNAASKVDNNINLSQGAPNLDTSNSISQDAQKRTKDDGIRIDRALTTDNSVAAGATQAFIGNGANVKAGGDVKVNAKETVTYSAKTGSGGLSGLASVNGSVAVANLGSVVKAFVGNGSSVTAGGSVDVKAKLTATDISSLAVGGSAALVAALGGQVAIINDTSIATAYIGQTATHGPSATDSSSASRVNAGGDVNVVADSQRSMSTKSIGATIGTVAAGAAVGKITISGATRAYVGDFVQIGHGGVPAPKKINISANSYDNGKTETYAVAAGLGAGSGNNSQVTINPTVTAGIYQRATVNSTEKISVTAQEIPIADAQGFGVQVGAVSVGVIIAKSDVSGTVAATLGASASLSSPGGLKLVSERVGSNVKANATAGTGGVLAGVNATMTEATSGGVVEASTGSNVRLPNGDVEIRAVNESIQSANSLGVAAGILAVGGVVSKASTTVSTKASMGTGTSSAGDRSGKLTIKATSSNDNLTKVVAGSGGVIAGNVALSETRNTSTVSAGIAGGAFSAGGVDISALNTSKYTPNVSSVNAALAGASGAAARNDEQASASVSIGNKTQIFSSGSVVVTAQTSFVMSIGGDGNSVTAGAGGVFNGTAAMSNSKLKGDSSVKIGDEVMILQTTSDTADNRGIVLSASTLLISNDQVKLSTGGLIQGAGTDSSLEGKLNNVVEIGSKGFIKSDRNISVGTYSTVNAQTVGDTTTYGLAGVGVARAKTDLNVNQSVKVSADTTLTALGNINLTPGEDTNPAASYKTSIYGYSSAQAYVRALIAIPDASANTSIVSNSELIVSQGAHVLSGQNVSLAAAPGVFTALAFGRGHGFILGLIPTSHDDSTKTTSQSSKVQLDGVIETGIYRVLDIVIQADPTDPSKFVDTSSVLFNPSNSEIPYLPVAVRYDSQFDPSKFINQHFTGTKAAALLESTSVTPVGAFFLSPLFATSGIVLLNAGTLSGSGSITTHGGARITVSNHSPNYLVFDTVNIPFLPGGKVIYTGAVNEVTIGGSGVQVTNLDEGDSIVSIRELYPFPVGTTGAGQPPRGPAIFLMGETNNLGGSVSVQNVGGSIGLGAPINAASVSINAPYGALVVETPKSPFVSGASPVAEWDSQMIWPGGNPRVAPPSAHVAASYAVNAYYNSPDLNGFQVYGTDSLLHEDGFLAMNKEMYHFAGDGNDQKQSFIIYGNPYPWGTKMIPYVRGADSFVPKVIGDSSKETNAALSPAPVTGRAYAISHSSTDDDNREGWFAMIPLQRLFLSIPDYRDVNLVKSNESAIEAGSIVIDAKIVNVDSRIIVGNYNSRLLRLGQDELDQINLARQSFAHGGPAIYTVTIANSNEFVQYDAQNHQILYSDRSASGGIGLISIKGAIISTNPLGNIKVKSPNGIVTVSNSTGVPLVLRNVNTGTRTLDRRNLARVDLIDLNEPVIAERHKLYVYEDSQDFKGIKLYVGTAGQSVEDLLASNPVVYLAGATKTQFEPYAGIRFQWQLRADLSRKVELLSSDYLQASEWKFKIPKNAINANDPWYYLSENGQPTPGTILGGNSLNGNVVAGPIDGPAFGQRITGRARDEFDRVLGPGTSIASIWTASYNDGDYGFVRRTDSDDRNSAQWNFHPVTEMFIKMTNSVKADNPIGIDFSEVAELTQSEFKVESNASVFLNGDIVNPNGTAIIRADLVDQATFDGSLIDTVADTIPLLALTGGLTSTNSGFGPRTGDAVVYRQNGGWAIGGLVDGREYFIIAPPRNGYTIPTVRVAATLDDAYQGKAIDITAGDGEDYSLDEIETTRDPITAIFSDRQIRNINEPPGKFSAIDFGFGLPQFFTGDPVVYNNGGGESIGGLVDGQTYYVILNAAYPGTLRLARTALDAERGVNIVFDSRGLGEQHSLKFVEPSPEVFHFDSNNVFVDSSLFGSPFPSTIQSSLFAGLQWKTGDAVVYQSGGAEPIGGLVDGQTYYVIVRDERTINLAATSADAFARTYVTFTSRGNGATYTLTQNKPGPVFFKATGIDTKLNAVVFDGPHGFGTGAPVLYRKGNGFDIPGLVDGTTYYVISVSSNRLKLAVTEKDAKDGTEIDLVAGDSQKYALRLASGGSITMSPNYAITTESLELYASGGIGSPGEPINVSLVGEGTVTAHAGSDGVLVGASIIGNLHLDIEQLAKPEHGVYLTLTNGGTVSGIGTKLKTLFLDTTDAIRSIPKPGISSKLGDVVIRSQDTFESDSGTSGTHISGRDVSIDVTTGSFGSTGFPVHVASSGVVNVTALGNIDLGVDKYDLRVRAIKSLTGDVSIVGGPSGGRVVDASGKTAGQVLNQEQLEQTWKNLGLTDPNATQETIIAFERQVESRYRELWQWLESGTVDGGNILSYATPTGEIEFSLATESLDLYRALAGIALGIPDASEVSDAQVQAFAQNQVNDIVRFFFKNLEDGNNAEGVIWVQRPEFQIHDPSYRYLIADHPYSRTQQVDLTKNSLWKSQELVAFVNRTALDPAGGALVGTGVPTISGRNVTFSGTGPIGRSGVETTISIEQFQQGTVTTAQIAELAVAIAPGDVMLKGTDASGREMTFALGLQPVGSTITGVVVRPTAPLFVAATGALNAQSSSILIQSTLPDVLLGTLSGDYEGMVSVTTAGNIFAAHEGTHLSGTLRLVSGQGSIGSASLPISFTGTVDFVFAKKDVFLRSSSERNVSLNELFAGGFAQLVSGGAIHPVTNRGINVRAESFKVTAGYHQDAAGFPDTKGIGDPEHRLLVKLGQGELNIPKGGRLDGNRILDSEGKQVGTLGRLEAESVGGLYVQSTDSLRVNNLTSFAANVDLVVAHGDAFLERLTAIQNWHDEVFVSRQPLPKIIVSAVDGSLFSGTTLGVTLLETTQMRLSAPVGTIGTPDSPIAVRLTGLPIYPKHVSATADLGVYLIGLEDLFVKLATSKTGDVRLVSEQGSIIDSGDTVNATVVGRNISLEALNGMIGADNRDLLVDSANPTAGVLKALAKLGVYVREVNGSLTVDRVSATAGNIRLRTPEVTDNTSDFHLPGGASVVASNEVLLQVGSDVNLDKGSLVQGGGPVTIQGDYHPDATFSPNRPTTFRIRGQVIGNPVQIIGNDPNNVFDPPFTDVSVSNVVDNASPYPGMVVTFTLTAINNGPVDAADVKVVTPLSSDLDFESADGDGVYDSVTHTVTWTVPHFARNTNQVFTLKAKIRPVSPRTEIATTVTVTFPSVTDINEVNNSATTNVTTQAVVLTNTTPVATIPGTEGLANRNVVIMTFESANPASIVSDFNVVGTDWGGSLVGTAPTLSIEPDPIYSGAGTGWQVVADTVTYGDVGTYRVSVTVRNVDGVELSANDTEIGIVDAVLTDATPVGSINSVEGTASLDSVLMRFVDANPYSVAGDFSVTDIDWGGILVGATPVLSVVSDPLYSGIGSGWMVVADSVAYANVGTFVVAITVRDIDGGTVSTSNTSVDVSNALLTNTTSPNNVKTEEFLAVNNVVLMKFEDANPYSVAANYSVTSVDWKGPLDGPTPVLSIIADPDYVGSGTGWLVVADSVTYGFPGDYTVEVTVADDDGDTVVGEQTTFQVALVRLADITTPAKYNALEGYSTGSIVLASFRDKTTAVTASDYTAIVDWGGAQVSKPTVTLKLVSRSATGVVWNVIGVGRYVDAGLSDVAVSINLKDGRSLHVKKVQVDVADAPLSDTTPATTRNVIEGKPTGQVTLATFSDANPWAEAENFTPTVNWGGSVVGAPSVTVKLVSRTSTASNWKVIGKAIFTKAGVYNIDVTINEQFGGSIQTNKTSFHVAGSKLGDTTPKTTYTSGIGQVLNDVVLMRFKDENAYADASQYTLSAPKWGGTLVGATPNLTIVRDLDWTGSGSSWKVVADAVSYTTKGFYTVEVSVTDEGGATAVSRKTRFEIVNAVLTNTTPANTIRAYEFIEIDPTIIATFSSSNAAADITDFATTVNWGGTLSGTPKVAVRLVSRTATHSFWEVVGTATYTIEGLYRISVKIKDNLGNAVIADQTEVSVLGER